MRISFSSRAWDDYTYWQTADADILTRVNVLIRETMRTPFKGIGKPEPLRNELTGWWSRRITLEHRIVYRVVGSGEEQTLQIAACRFHYTR